MRYTSWKVIDSNRSLPMCADCRVALILQLRMSFDDAGYYLEDTFVLEKVNKSPEYRYRCVACRKVRKADRWA